MPEPHLPTPLKILNSLFNQLPTKSEEEEESTKDPPTTKNNTSSSTSLKHTSIKNKQLLLTLHCIFPNEFLSALDLLDRGLVFRFVIIIDQEKRSCEDTNLQGEFEEGGSVNDNSVYYVRSTAQSSRNSSRFHGSDYGLVGVGTGVCYEVRLKAWNCSCPAFTFSAFSGLGGVERKSGFDDDNDDGCGEKEERELEGKWSFGGLLSGGEDNVPICKHLLACVLIERCGLMSGCVDQKVVGRGEAAGWGAGWG